MDSLSIHDSSFAKRDEFLYKKWFHYADIDEDGRINGAEAVRFFSFSKLSRDELKQVWALADSKRQGHLGYHEFVTAMQVISLVQTGNIPSADMLVNLDIKNISPPIMEGLDEMLSAEKNLEEVDVNMETLPPQEEPPARLFRRFSQKLVKKEHSVQVESSHFTSIIDGLQKLYTEKLRPLEVAYQFNEFGFPPLTENDLNAKPMVMLLGQYSTGKTTFIKHLLKTEYPGAHIGPEPTTDCFTIVMNGSDSRTIPGNTVAIQANMPFTGLTKFGSAFLSKFQCSQMHHPLLEQISFIDTPGILSGEKQRINRNYDFTGVTEWFAAKCNLILLFFDPHKLDISDELKRVILSLRGHEDKIRIVLNRVDQVNTFQLMRVYGALMWYLGKVLKTPEVFRVYVGSFSDNAINEDIRSSIGKELLEPEQASLLADLKDIPRKSCDRMIHEFVKRVRAAKIHVYLLDHFKKEMPAIFGKKRAQQRLIEKLEGEFKKVQIQYRFPVGDLPDVDHYKDVLSRCNIDKFENLKPEAILAIDEMLNNDLPNLMKKFSNPYGI